MIDVHIRDKDIRRVAQTIHRHMTTRATDPFRGAREMWSVLRFAMYAYPILVHHGYLGVTEDVSP